MEINVRKDNCFIEDEKWHEMYGNYSKFLEPIGTDARLVLLELGVCLNTPESSDIRLSRGHMIIQTLI